VPQTGFVEALDRGSSEITATAGDVFASVTVTVLARATLALFAPVATHAALAACMYVL
jgi:hypothetical protein